MKPPISLALLLACMAAGLPALEVEVQAGFRGVVTLGRWAPLRVSWRDAPPGAELEIARPDGGESDGGPSDGGEAGVVETFGLAETGSLEYPFLAEERTPSLRLRVRSEGELLLERRVALLGRTFPGHLVLCVDLPDGWQRAIGQGLAPLEPVEAVALETRDFPLLPLGLDAVAAIAIRDGRAAFSPAQRAAISSWLASGGRLLLLESREDGGGLASGLGAKAEGAGFAATTPVGLGAIEVMGAPPTGRDGATPGEFWKRHLGLEPFGSDSRIAAGRIPGFAPASARLDSPLFRVEPVLVAGSALWVLALVLLARLRRGFLLAGLLSLALCGAAGAGAALLDSARGGLAVGTRRAVVLADGSAVVQDSVARLRPVWNLDLRSLIPRSALALVFDGADRGQLGADGRLRLLHADMLPSAVPSAVGGSAVEFLSFRTAAEAAGRTIGQTGGRAGPDLAPRQPVDGSEAWSREAAGEVAYAPAGGGDRWFQASPLGWLPLAGAPDFLGADASWAEALRKDYPALDLVFGRGTGGRGSLVLAGGADGPALWVRPFPGAEREPP